MVTNDPGSKALSLSSFSSDSQEWLTLRPVCVSWPRSRHFLLHTVLSVQIGNRLPLLKKLQRHSLPTCLSTNSSPRHTRLSTKQPQPAFPALSHCGLVQIVYPKHTPSPFFPTCLTVSILSWNVPSLPIKLLSITHVHASTSLKISLGHSQTYLCCR